jgi:hypothetical protein
MHNRLVVGNAVSNSPDLLKTMVGCSVRYSPKRECLIEAGYPGILRIRTTRQANPRAEGQFGHDSTRSRWLSDPFSGFPLLVEGLRPPPGEGVNNQTSCQLHNEPRVHGAKSYAELPREPAKRHIALRRGPCFSRTSVSQKQGRPRRPASKCLCARKILPFRDLRPGWGSM